METLQPPYHRNYPEDRVYLVPMDAIDNNPTSNSRGAIHVLDVLELARQIKQEGLIQPITILRQDKEIPFRIVAGYRRYEAHKINKETHVKCLIRNTLTDLEAWVINLTENLQRQDLKIDQEAKVVKHFIMADWSDKEIGAKIGKSSRWVAQRRMFLDLPPQIQDYVVQEMISTADIPKIIDAGEWGEEAQMAAAKRFMDDKVKGRKKKVEGKEAGKEAMDTKEVRDLDEIASLQATIQEVSKIDDPLALVLGWSIGYVNPSDMHAAVQQYIRKMYNRYYEIPAFAQKEESDVEAATVP